MKRDEFQDVVEELQKEIVVPDIVMAKAMTALDRIREEQKQEPLSDKGAKVSARPGKSRFRKKKIVFLAAAAVLAVGGVTAGAAAYMKWSQGLSEGMPAKEEVRRELEETQMAVPVNQSVTENGITITVVQSIVDSYYAHIAFKIEGYQVEPGVQPWIEDVDVTVDGYNSMDSQYDEEKEFNWGGSFYDGTIAGENGYPVRASDGTPLAELIEQGEKTSYMLDDGSIEFDLTLTNARKKGIFFGKPIHVELTNLGRIVDKTEFASDIEGTWSFDWILNGSEELKTCEPNTPLGDTGITVKQAELSPISLNVIYDMPRGKEKDYLLLLGVRLKDGTLLPHLYLGPGSTGYLSTVSEDYQEAFAIDRILDVNEIDALLFRKNTPEIGQPYTEDDLYIVPV